VAPQIRRAELGDAARVGEMHAAAFAELYSAVLPTEVRAQLDAQTMASLWQRFVSRGERYVQWVAVDRGRIVGFAGVGPGRETGYDAANELYFLVVEPAARRKGVGRALLKRADADYVWVWEQNRSAQKFYRKQRFYPDSVARDGKLFETPIPEVRMSR
jgi:GNAT superfamily N-acetyltransferase